MLVYMKPAKLKHHRQKLNARQQDMAKLLGVAIRTYQNWEQPETSKAHRKIPDDAAEKIKCLIELKEERDRREDTSTLPSEIAWLQIPFTSDLFEEFKRAAWQEDKSVSLFIQEALLEKLNSPRSLPESSVFDE